MEFIFAAAVLFGLVHPGSKLIMNQGIDLLSFCILYVLIRLVAQLPMVLKNRTYLVENAKTWIYLFGIGIVGAGLQFNEFKGIANGLPIPIVTFLVYSHPIWSLIFSRFINNEPMTGAALLRLALGVVGIFCILGSDIKFGQQDPMLMLPPLFAGVLIALWVSLSNKAKNLGASTWTISFYYDVFALGALVVLRIMQPETPLSSSSSAMSVGELAHWLSVPSNLLMITIYSIFVGLLPNILFYEGNASSTARSAGLILLIEPLVATFVSHWIWHDLLSPYFFLGSVLILISGVSMKSLKFPRLCTALASILFLVSIPSNFSVASDTAAVHGMLVFGDRELYFSHLPMFHSPHDYQTILRINLGASETKFYLSDQVKHPNTIYTFVPQPMVLPDVVKGKKSFKGDLYRGHFERGGVVIKKSIAVQILDVIYFHQFDPTEARPVDLTYLVFGEGRNVWAAHLISEKPDFDHIAKLATNSQSSELKHATLATFSGISNTRQLLDGQSYRATLATGHDEVIGIKTNYIEFDDLSM